MLGAVHMVDPITGMWWIAADPDKRVPGTVTATISGSFRLLKRLAGNSQFREHSLSLIPGETIHGLAQSTEYTLYNCYFIESKGPWFSHAKPPSDNNEIDPERSEMVVRTSTKWQDHRRSTLLRAARFELTDGRHLVIQRIAKPQSI